MAQGRGQEGEGRDVLDFCRGRRQGEVKDEMSGEMLVCYGILGVQVVFFLQEIGSKQRD